MVYEVRYKLSQFDKQAREAAIEYVDILSLAEGGYFRKQHEINSIPRNGTTAQSGQTRCPSYARCATSTMQKIDMAGGINMEPRRSHFIFQSIRVNFCNGGRALDRLIPAV